MKLGPTYKVSEVVGVVAAVSIGWIAAVSRVPLLGVAAAALLTSAAIVSFRDFVGTHETTKENAEMVRRLRSTVQTVNQELQQTRASAQAAAAGVAKAADVAARIEEEVRANINAELHDSVTQTLVAAIYATHDPNTSQDTLVDLLRTAEAELRAVMADQSPLRGSQDSLGDQVTKLATRLEELRGLTTHVDWPEDDGTALPSSVALVIYRFIQEGLMNVVKHANTTTAWVRMYPKDDLLCVEVEDQGKGFNPADVPTSDHLGLRLLKMRSEVTGGKVSVQSTPGAGSLLLLKVPFQHPLAGSHG